MDIQQLLPHILPATITWAENQADQITLQGASLNGCGIEIAKSVGVQQPEKIRVLETEHLPLPPEGPLRQAAAYTGLLSADTIGITFGHSIMLRRSHLSARLLSHECRHVYQYEQAGSIAAFLTVYLQQIAAFGYAGAPLEIDARSHEVDGNNPFR